MQTKPWFKMAALICLMGLLLTLPFLSACGGGEEATPTATVTEEPTATEEEVSEFDVVKEAVEDYLGDRAGNIDAADLQMMIAEGNAPYIVSLRSAADYAKGHIPGAVNISFGEITTLPENEDIVVYCYTGQSASFATASLGILGYDVQNLRHGMASWTTNPDVYVSRFDPATSQGDYAVETQANSVSVSFDYPVLNNTSSNDEDEILEAAVATVSPKYITASDLNMKIAEGEDMTIISIRSAELYAGGHIPGAINISLNDLADNLDKIDPGLPVYVYCYTGHSAAQATALLQMLGYDASSLKFGMCSWSSDPAINNNSCFDASTAQNYDVEK